MMRFIRATSVQQVVVYQARAADAGGDGHGIAGAGGRRIERGDIDQLDILLRIPRSPLQDRGPP
jgi:hypothetical protein